MTGPDGLLKQLTKRVLETALNEEMTEHLGYEKHETAGTGSGNIRDGSRPKTVLTDASGPVQIDVPRDRAGSSSRGSSVSGSAACRGSTRSSCRCVPKA